jgi:hypothetical protein
MAIVSIDHGCKITPLLFGGTWLIWSPFISFLVKFMIQNEEVVRLWQDNWKGSILKETLSTLYTFVYNCQITIKEAKIITNLDDHLRQPLTQQERVLII